MVVLVGYLPKPVTPATPVAQRRKLGKRLCQPAYQRAVGGTLADRATSILTWTLFTPSQAQLERGARWVRCDVVARSGDKLVPLPTSKPMLAQGVPEQLRICQTEAGVDISCSKPHAFRVAGGLPRRRARPTPTPRPTPRSRAPAAASSSGPSAASGSRRAERAGPPATGSSAA